MTLDTVAKTRSKNFMDYKLVDIEPNSVLLDSVIALGNGPAKRWLGPMPNAGYEERATRGTLLGAVAGGQLAGYVLYDLPPDRVKIGHLCVADHARGRGIAAALITELQGRYADRSGLQLACRRDYPADKVWPRLGFRPANTKVGRSKAQHALTIWVLDHGNADLFSAHDETREWAALDHNVFLDLVAPAGRHQAEASRELLAGWLSEYLDLCITDEVFLEIDRVESADQRRSLQSHAGGFHILGRGRPVDKSLEREAARLTPRAGQSDHRHVARASANGAAYLVTRDEELLAAAPAIVEALGVSVLPPAALISLLDARRSGSDYAPAALAETALQQRQVGPDDLALFVKELQNHGAPDRAHRLRDALARAVTSEHRQGAVIISREGGGILGGYIREPTEGGLDVTALRVPGRTSQVDALARHLVFEQRRQLAEEGGGTVRISDPCPSPAVIRALPPEHFSRTSDGWAAEVRTGLVNGEDIAPIAGTGSAAEHERRFWPQRVLGAGIPTYMIPIKAAYAEQLLDPSLAAQTLLPRQTLLGLSREHVYYRRPRNHGGIARNARILWYVAGSTASHSSGSVRAVSTVEEVVVAPARRLYKRYAKFGVYRERDVLSAANAQGVAMAIRFSSTEALGRPVDLHGLRQVYAEAGERFHAPQAPRLISERMFCLIYRASSSYA